MPFEQGPYLQAALFCERVLDEKDGVISLIRIIDRITQTASGPAPPEIMQPFPYSLTAVIVLKSGEARGSVQVRLEVEQPSGIKNPVGSMTTLMEGEDRGQNLIINIRMEFKEQGLYWFNVYIDNTLLTRMPLRVVYMRVTGTPPQR